MYDSLMYCTFMSDIEWKWLENESIALGPFH